MQVHNEGSRQFTVLSANRDGRVSASAAMGMIGDFFDAHNGNAKSLELVDSLRYPVVIMVGMCRVILKRDMCD